VRWLSTLGLEPTAYRRGFDSHCPTVEHNLRPGEGETDTERCGDGAGRLTAGMHPLGERRFLLIKRLGVSYVLSAFARRLARCCAAFPTEFKFRFGEAGQGAGRVRPVARQWGDQP
jgi:hypothetical protein